MKFRTVTTHYVDYRDLETFIEEYSGHKFDVVASEEGHNDSTLTFDIDGKLDQYDLEKIVRWLTGEWVYSGTRVILNKLCAEGQIPAGKYAVEISW